MKVQKILLFDIDGTLLLTGGAGRIAFEKAVEELFGFKNSWGNLIPDGKTDPMIIEEIMTPLKGSPLSQSEYDELCRRYHAHFEIEIARVEKFQIMPGIVELLDRLSGNPSFALGIATGNFKKAADMKLRRGSLEHYFTFGGFACDAADRRELTKIGYERGKTFCGENIASSNVVVIGDTIHDIRAGKSIGAKTVAVCTGSTLASTLQSLEPDYLFQDLRDTRAFLSILE